MGVKGWVPEDTCFVDTNASIDSPSRSVTGRSVRDVSMMPLSMKMSL